MLFMFRQVFEFYPGSEEPEEGWLGEVAYNAVEFGRYLEQAVDVSELPPIPTWSESKQRSREALKKLGRVHIRASTMKAKYKKVRKMISSLS